MLRLDLVGFCISGSLFSQGIWQNALERCPLWKCLNPYALHFSTNKRHPFDKQSKHNGFLKIKHWFTSLPSSLLFWTVSGIVPPLEGTSSLLSRKWALDRKMGFGPNAQNFQLERQREREQGKPLLACITHDRCGWQSSMSWKEDMPARESRTLLH